MIVLARLPRRSGMRRHLLSLFALASLVSSAIAQSKVNDSARLTFKQVTAGLGGHTCALSTSGAAYCWGLNNAGQLGANTTDRCRDEGGEQPCAKTPLVVSGDNTYIAITAGAAHTCALTADGRAFCWGLHDSGAIGSDSAKTPCPNDASLTCQVRAVPVVGDLRFSSIVAGGFHTCALTAEGRAYCWGLDNQGQLGVGNPPDRCTAGSDKAPCSLQPLPVNRDARFTALVAGYYHTCGIAVDSLLDCWGENSSGELGPFASLHVITVSAGAAKTCAIFTTGATMCWGVFNVGPDLREAFTQPQALGKGPQPRFTAISVGGEHGCGLTADSSANCWGEGRQGQLGIGGFDIVGLAHVGREGSNEPRAVAGHLKFTAVSAGGLHTCALTGDGTIYCWGSGPYGQLGIGSTGKKGKPEAIHAPIPAPLDR